MFQGLVHLITNALHFFYGFTKSYALAIVLLTLVIKLILHPLTRTQLKSMKGMQMLAPKMEELRRKYKDDPQRLNKELMQLYRAHGVNPFGGCLPMLIQLPVLWALFRALYTPGLFSGATIFGIPLDAVPRLSVEVLTKHPIWMIFPILVGATTYLQQHLTVTDPAQARMFVLMPLMVAYFATLMPIGVSVYWIVSTLAYLVEYLIVVGRPRLQAQRSAPARVVQKGARRT
ncbi:MAG: YidC/Oxa1 family membrane protein insertase [Armatimonadota bacterium]|nr:YidC/Oxa1 family membrane protein insertase [Armatimonadota bacterium]MDR5702023.1 YidC/Oxa1 family membrane protein insertase [Armatimonadota bacterium]MDR7434679.1 YidC/Oxa1 family membrane protein insertase [Armatimonadota bacterium]